MRALAAAVLPLLLAACASAPPPLTPAIPADFSLRIRSEGATNPHCDFTIEVDATGRTAYSIEHLGRNTADRRGVAQADPAALQRLWTAVEESGLFRLSPFLAPQEGREDLGTVRYRVRGDGGAAAVVADHAFHSGLNGILRAAIAIVPWRAWQIPGEPPPR